MSIQIHKEQFEKAYRGNKLYSAILDGDFDEHGVAYKSRIHRFFWWDAFENIVQLLQLTGTEQTLLNVGVGFGFDEKVLNMRYPNLQLLGVDIAEFMVDSAKLNASPVKLAVAVGEHLPLRDASIDRIITREVIEHVLDPEMFLRELHRVAVPGAVVVVTTPNPTSLAYVNVRNRILRILGMKTSGYGYKEQFLSGDILNSLFHQAGFVHIEHRFDGACKFWLSGSPRLPDVFALPFARMVRIFNSVPFARLFCDQAKYAVRMPAATVKASAFAPTWVCPVCFGSLRAFDSEIDCEGCRRKYQFTNKGVPILMDSTDRSDPQDGFFPQPTSIPSIRSARRIVSVTAWFIYSIVYLAAVPSALPVALLFVAFNKAVRQ